MNTTLLSSSVNSQSMKVPKVEARQVTTTWYYLRCPECKRELVADSEAKVLYQFQLHLRLKKHGDNEQ